MESSHPTSRRALIAAVTVAAALVASACTGAPRPGSGDVAAGDFPTGDDTSTGGLADIGTPTTAPTLDGSSTDGDPGVGGSGASSTRGTTGTGSSSGNSGTGGSGTGSGGGASTPTVSRLFSEENNFRGITRDRLVLCAHAALTYGAAFNTSADDLNVYWTAVNEAGGVFGRRVDTFYENDNYSPDTAITAATACKDKYDPFMVLGGIGFDQIPAVRKWAQDNKVLYFHHTATENDTADKTHSFTGLPTTEKIGTMFAELFVSKFSGKKLGIVKRGSPNWEPGVKGFKDLAARRGVEILLEREVAVNKRNYIQDIIDLKDAGSEVVWVWLNALESTEFIKQSVAQNWRPQFMVFPFNLTAQTLGDNALRPPIVGVAMFNAFSLTDDGGEFARYRDDKEQFEQQYAKYRPSVDLGGVGGDLLFLNWSAQKSMHQLLLKCGPACNRNAFVDVVKRFNGTTNSSACSLNFTRPDSANGHRGGFQVSAMEAYRSPDGKVNFRNTHTCVEHLI